MCREYMPVQTQACAGRDEGTAGFGMLQVTLGDTTGTGNPTGVGEMNLVEILAGHVRSHLRPIILLDLY
jgi:hypothetical protein